MIELWSVTARVWPCWEEWEHGWQLIDDRLHFEGEDITPMLPPYLITHDGELGVPRLPSVHPETEPRDWTLHFHFENGWEAQVFAEWGVAKNACGIYGFNRRILGKQLWPVDREWDDNGVCWAHEELNPDCVGPLLEDPDDLVACLQTIAVLPSDPDLRRVSGS